MNPYAMVDVNIGATGPGPLRARLIAWHDAMLRTSDAFDWGTPTIVVTMSARTPKRVRYGQRRWKCWVHAPAN